jgi:GT2 family glycosyltransferase
VDGLTYNAAEAEAAQPWYRQVQVADLENCSLAELFGDRVYDFIVCADVLEHLRAPERLLRQCQALLAPGGQLLTSIPNAGHAGLIGELMAGRLQYREEGLLDRTHLRFFTRQSWLGFLAEQGWGAIRLAGIQRDVPQSEFNVAFDLLPSAVSAYVLALPDARTYQFITACLADTPHAVDLAGHSPAMPATFGTTLYWDLGGGFQESLNSQASGQIGQAFQSIEYSLPDSPGLCGLRLDPSDRPGFMRWHRLELIDATGRRVWEADCQRQGETSLKDCRLHQISLAPAISEHSGLLSTLEGDDPWLELPRDLPWAKLAGGLLRVTLGWPASTDYLALLSHLRALQPGETELARLRQAWSIDQERTQSLQAQLTAMEREWRHEHEQAVKRHEHILALEAQRQQTEQALAQAQQTLHRLQEAAAVPSPQPVPPPARSLAGRARRAVGRWLKRVLPTRPQVLAASTDEPPTLAQPIAPSTPHPLRPSPVEPGGDAAIVAQARPAEPWPPIESPGKEVPPPIALTESVDVIVPVYRGLDDTRLCLESVLAHPQSTPMRLIVINDASPEPALADWLRQWCALRPEVVLLENETNLGFVATVNRGMSCSDAHDVVLLNSDTEVANDWLDRLRRAAYSAPAVASVTPFSNNATICSYPRFCEPNDLPAALGTAELDQLFARLNPGLTVDIPTAIGFCMYIRRECLQTVGDFDVENFGKGYGEENDFCCRASAAGWRHLHALDTFVLHRGGVSFGDTKNERERAAMRTMRRLHPGYEIQVKQFVDQDPAHPARQRVDLARLQASGRPKVLAVSHNGGGGTLQHIQELAHLLGDQADFLLLRPFEGGEVRLTCVDPKEGFLECFQMPDQIEPLRARLSQLGVVHLHFHHLMDHGGEVLNLPRDLLVSADFTAHDYYPMCPQLSLVDVNSRYCGEKGLDQCRRCLIERPAPDNKSIELWHRDHRALLQQMRFVLAPSLDAARRMHSFVPQAQVRLAPHPDLPNVAALPAPNPQRLAPGARLKVAVIGALNTLKGADLLEQVALLAAKDKIDIDFHLLGYAYRDLITQPTAHLTVHGKYSKNALPELLAWLQPDLVWFPVQAPETYSYTLSACLRAGLPIAAPILGAFPARLAGRPWTWLRDWNSDASTWLAFLAHVKSQHFATGAVPDLPAPERVWMDESPFLPFDYFKDYLPPNTP